MLSVDVAREGLDLYNKWSEQYRKSNGWTVIPADATPPSLNGVPLTSDVINRLSTMVETYRLWTQKPQTFVAYVTGQSHEIGDGIVTTWTGHRLGRVVTRGNWHRNNFGGRWRSVRMRALWGACYYGREYDSMQLVRFRRLSHA